MLVPATAAIAVALPFNANGFVVAPFKREAPR
jgi:hypothetical protein